MTKPAVFIAYPKYFIPRIHNLLIEKFDVKYWIHSHAVTREELINEAKGKFALVINSRIPIRIDGDFVKRSGGSLRVLSYLSASMELVNIEELKALGVKIGGAGPAITEATAEHAVTLLLTVARNVIPVTLAYKSTAVMTSWTVDTEFYQGLENSVVGIIGAGLIGTSVAEKLKSFKISRLLYSSRSVKQKLQNLGGERKSIEEIMKESDFIVVCLAQNAETKGIISRRMISLMKPTSIIVNVARGGLIDQEALVEALQNKKIRGAGLDVTTPEPLPLDHSLLKLDNVVITPHVGYTTTEYMRQIAKYGAGNIIAVLEGLPMPWPV